MMQSFRLKLGDAWQWWLTGLRSGLSKPSTDIRHHALTIKPVAGRFHYQVWDVSSQALVWLRTPSHLTEMGVAHDLADYLKRDKKVVLLLPAEQVLLRTVTLPLAARIDLQQILKLEIDKLTPFEPESVFFSWHILTTDSQKNSLTLRLVVTPKNLLLQQLKQLAEAGIDVDIVTTEDSACRDHINLIPTHKQGINSNLIWASLALVTVLSALYLPVISEQQRLQGLEQKVDVMRAEAKVARKQTLLAEQQQEQLNFLLEQAQQHRWLMVFNNLSELMPTDSWIERFRVQQTRIEIEGLSTSAAALIEVFERSHVFEKVSFESPVTRDQRTGKQRFHISLQLENSHE